MSVSRFRNGLDEASFRDFSQAIRALLPKGRVEFQNRSGRFHQIYGKIETLVETDIGTVGPGTVQITYFSVEVYATRDEAINGAANRFARTPIPLPRGTFRAPVGDVSYITGDGGDAAIFFIRGNAICWVSSEGPLHYPPAPNTKPRQINPSELPARRRPIHADLDCNDLAVAIDKGLIRFLGQ